MPRAHPLERHGGLGTTLLSELEKLGIRVIDAHLHLPHRYRDPVEAARYLVGKMDSAGIEKAVVIAIEAGVESFKRRVRARSIKSAVGEVLDYIAHSRSPMMRRLVYEPEKSIEEHIKILLAHRRPTEEVLAAARAYPDRLVPVASCNPDLGVEKSIERLEEYAGEILGVKLYPTLHCRKPSDPGLEKLYRTAEKHDWVIIVHTGCDPGMWELPRFCRHARPRFVAEAARRHPDLTFIIAHLGSYSLLMPGIYYREAIEALTSLENVYADTSAVDPLFIERAVEEAGYEKLLYGSDFPYMVGLSIEDPIRDILALDIPERAKRAILRYNAERLLREHGKM